MAYTSVLRRLRFWDKHLEPQHERDALTGLMSRALLEARLGRIVDDARHHGAAVSLVMGAADQVQQIRETFSPRVADDVLRTVASIVAQLVRKSDIVARFSDEELVIVFPDTTLTGAALVCERIRAAVSAYAWEDIHPELTVTLSLGLTESLGATRYEALLERAAEKLAEAKRRGHNCLVS